MLIEPGCTTSTVIPFGRKIARRGGSGLLVFVAQRPDAARVAPCRAIDPDFARALTEARRSGVRLLAFNCDVSPAGCRLRERIPVVLT